MPIKVNYWSRAVESRLALPKKLDHTRYSHVAKMVITFGLTINLPAPYTIMDVDHYGRELGDFSYRSQYSWFIQKLHKIFSKLQLSYYAVPGCGSDNWYHQIHIHAIVGYNPKRVGDQGKSRISRLKNEIRKSFYLNPSKHRRAICIRPVKASFPRYLEKNIGEFDIDSPTQRRPVEDSTCVAQSQATYTDVSESEGSDLDL